ncbi:MAG: hypothetical protein LBG06_02305 [Deltaproteobacteria bacterium]|nr:hypothetical protein [Deltaproteobacteria bacterium]
MLDSSWELHAAGAFPAFSSFLAGSQLAGRGRFGRAWASPPGHVYASLRLPLAPPFEGSAASVAFALFLSLALEDVLGLRFSIKWPNDLLLDGRKAGGILLENRRGALMAGIGLNLGAPPELPPGRDPGAPPPGAIPEARLSGRGGPTGLWKELVKCVLLRYNDSFVTRDHASVGTGRPERPARVPPGFAVLLDAASSRLHGLGGRVRVERPCPQARPGETSLTGRIVGLDAAGALLVETREGIRALWSGTLLSPPA